MQDLKDHSTLYLEKDTLSLSGGSVLINDRNFVTVKKVFRLMNHDDTKAIISAIQESELEELTVTEIYVKVRIEQSAASNILGSLKRLKIVNSRRAGKHIYYSLNLADLLRVSLFISRVSNGFNIGVAYEKVRALDHKKRKEILTFLYVGGPRTVKYIYRSKDWEQSSTSHNLGILRASGFVSTERLGKNIRYYLSLKEIGRVCELVNNFCKTL